MPAAAEEAIAGRRHDFRAALTHHGLAPLRRGVPRTLQVNVGKLCNQACHHCHVDAGPKRTEIMERRTASRVLALVAANPAVGAVDITGGAPELNPNFADLVEGATALGRQVIIRCNLTVLFEPGMEHLPDLYRRNAVELTCSLPCYTADNVDQQRGRGVFDRSIEALQLLNRIGYGRPGSNLCLNLVYNPLGDFLPPQQDTLEAKYREELGRLFDIEFHHLYTLTNMPIRRFADQLRRNGRFDAYLGLLVNHFNPRTVEGLMCRDLVSVDWEGRLYDCDFNQMLEIALAGESRPRTIWEVERLSDLAGLEIATAAHCFGCTAGAGSSCDGSLA